MKTHTQDRIVVGVLALFCLALIAAVPSTITSLTTYDTVFDLAQYANPLLIKSAHVRGYYSPGDGGGGNFYATNSVTATNIGTRIKALAGPGTYSWDRLSSDQIDARWFGAKCDGLTDDTSSAVAMCAVAKNGSILLFPSPTLIKSSVTANSARITLDNLTNITLRGYIYNDELSETAAAWKTISSMTSVGTTVTVTTAAAHTLSPGIVVCVFTSSDKNYKGAVTVVTTPDSTHFTYTTLGGTPAGAASGTMRYAVADYDRQIFKFTRCKNVIIDLAFTGQYEDRSVRSRLGVVPLAFKDVGGVGNQFAKIRLNVYGASYGIWAGDYLSTTMTHVTDATAEVNAENIGYPIASWGAFHRSSITINATDVHRGLYSTGMKDSKIRVRVKNFDVAGALISSHYDGTTHWGAEDLDVDVADTGSDQLTSYLDSSGRYLCGIIKDQATGTPTFRNIRVHVFLKTTDTIGRGTVAFNCSEVSGTGIFDNITLSGMVDRSGVTVTASQPVTYEAFIRPTGTIKNFTFRDFRTVNSASLLAASLVDQNLFRRDIQVSGNSGLWAYYNSASDSMKNVSITGSGTIMDFDQNGEVNAAWYCHADGVTDDQAALTQAIAATPNGGRLHIPKGTYAILSALTITKSIWISGDPGTILKFNPATETSTFIVVQADGVMINGLELDGNAKPITVLRIDNQNSGSDHVKIFNCNIHGSMANGVNDPSAVASSSGILITRACDDVEIAFNWVHAINHVSSGVNRVSGGIWVSDFGYTTTADKVSAINIHDNLVEDVAQGIEGAGFRVNTQYNTYDGTTATSGYQNGVRFVNNHGRLCGKRVAKNIGNGTLWLGNYFESSDSNEYSAASFYGSDISVIDNVAVGLFADKVFEFGTGDTSGTAEIVKNIVCTGNRVQTTGAAVTTSQAFRINGNLQNALVANNYANDVGYIVYATGRAWNVQFNNLGGTNIANNGIHLDTDGTYAPWNCQINNINVVGAVNAVFIGTGTNNNVGMVSGNVSGSLISIGSGVPVFYTEASRTVFAAADQAVTSSTTLVDATSLAVSLEKNRNYKFRAVLQVDNAGTAAGVKLAMAGPTSPTSVILNGVLENGTSTILHQTVGSLTTVISGGIGTTGLKYAVLEGTILNGSNRGDLKIQFAQNASDANATTLKKGSFLTVWQLN